MRALTFDPFLCMVKSVSIHKKGVPINGVSPSMGQVWKASLPLLPAWTVLVSFPLAQGV
jgi:hypothetical protein